MHTSSDLWTGDPTCVCGFLKTWFFNGYRLMSKTSCSNLYIASKDVEIFSFEGRLDALLFWLNDILLLGFWVE